MAAGRRLDTRGMDGDSPLVEYLMMSCRRQGGQSNGPERKSAPRLCTSTVRGRSLQFRHGWRPRRGGEGHSLPLGDDPPVGRFSTTHTLKILSAARVWQEHRRPLHVGHLSYVSSCLAALCMCVPSAQYLPHLARWPVSGSCLFSRPHLSITHVSWPWHLVPRISVMA